MSDIADQRLPTDRLHTFHTDYVHLQRCSHNRCAASPTIPGARESVRVHYVPTHFPPTQPFLVHKEKGTERSSIGGVDPSAHGS